jgi:ATP-binding cassette subfamily C protein
VTDFAQLLADLRSVFGIKLFLIAILMAVVGITEGFSIVLLLPLLARLGVAGSMDQSGTAANLLGSLNTWLGDRIEPLVALIVLTILLSSALFLLQSWLLARLSQRYAAHWKQRQLRAFFDARWLFFMRHKAGELMNAIVTEPNRLSAAAMNVLSLTASLIIGLTYLIYAMLLSWQATLLLLAGSACLVLSIKRLYRQSRRIGSIMGPLNARQQVVVGEFLQGAKLVKAASIENVAIERSMAVVRDMEINQARAVFMPSLVRGIFEAASLTMLVLMLVFSRIGATANLFVVLALFLRLFPRISTLQQFIHLINTYAPAVMALRRLF